MKKNIVIALISFTCNAVIAQGLYQMPKSTQFHVRNLKNLNGAKGQSGKSNACAKGAVFTSFKSDESTMMNFIVTKGCWFIMACI